MDSAFEALKRQFEATAAFAPASLYGRFGPPPLTAIASVIASKVIASKVSSLPEAVGDSAMLVNPENVFDIAPGIWEDLLNADARRRTLIRSGKEWAVRFSWETTAREVSRITNRWRKSDE